jgi:hypothetical protein
MAANALYRVRALGHVAQGATLEVAITEERQLREKSSTKVELDLTAQPKRGAQDRNFERARGSDEDDEGHGGADALSDRPELARHVERCAEEHRFGKRAERGEHQGDRE